MVTLPIQTICFELQVSAWRLLPKSRQPRGHWSVAILRQLLQAQSKCTEHTVLHGSACIASDTRLCSKQDKPALLPTVQYWKGRLCLSTDGKSPITAFQQTVKKQQTDKKQQFLPGCRFPAVERMGQEVLSVQRLTHGYQDRTLFKNCDFEMEKSERVALIGKPPFFVPLFLHSTPPLPPPCLVSPLAVTLAPTLVVSSLRLICSATNEPFTVIFFLFRFSTNKLCKVYILIKEKIHDAQSEGVWGKPASTDLKQSHRTDYSYWQELTLCSCCMCSQQIGRLHGQSLPHTHTAGFMDVATTHCCIPVHGSARPFTIGRVQLGLKSSLPTLLASQSAPSDLQGSHSPLLLQAPMAAARAPCYAWSWVRKSPSVAGCSWAPTTSCLPTLLRTRQMLWT